MTRGCKAPPTRPNARGPRSEHPRTRTPRIRQRARPGGNLQRKNRQPVSRGPQGRRAAPPLLRCPAPGRAGRGTAWASGGGGGGWQAWPGRCGRGALGPEAGSPGRPSGAGEGCRTLSGPGSPHPLRPRRPAPASSSPRTCPGPPPGPNLSPSLRRRAPGRRPPPAPGKDTKYTERKMSAQQSRREKTNTTASILLHGRRRSFRETGSGAPTHPAPP